MDKTERDRAVAAARDRRGKSIVSFGDSLSVGASDAVILPLAADLDAVTAERDALRKALAGIRLMADGGSAEEFGDAEERLDAISAAAHAAPGGE